MTGPAAVAAVAAPAGFAILTALAAPVALMILVALAPAPATAQGWIEPRPGVGDWGVVRIRTDVRVNVTGRVAEVEVEEWFENRGGGMGEGDYVYPLPGEAVFSNFSLFMGDQELRGETMDADRAREIYEDIVRRQKDPALIELIGHGLLRARVFPIEPGQRRRITLRYTQVLERAGDALQLRYAAGGAFGGAPRPIGPERPGLPQPSRPAPDGAPLSFTLTADAAPFGDPFSPTHALDVERRDGRLVVRPERELSGDFAVFLPLARDLVGVTLATHRPSSEPGYFMLTLSPGTVRAGATPRDITAVVDVSGSMSGEKMEQTRDALRQLLGSLRPEDRFRLVAFSNGVRTSGEGWTRADADGIRAARRWVDGLRAEGGTNIDGALEEAFRLESPEERLPIVVFLTDGLPTVGEQNPERIAAEAESERGRARVFAFGVGYDVNTYLLDRLSDAGRGSTAYVEPGEDVEVALGTLAARITHPVLTDLELDDAPVRLTEIYPTRLPDLFAGEELVLFGRYEEAGEGRLTLSGRRSGRTERFGIVAEFSSHTQTNDFIPRLWASRKLGELARAVRLNGADPELVEEIRRTALRYGLLSEYTSYLVLEPNAVVATGGVRMQGSAADAAAGGTAAAPVPATPALATGQAAVEASEAARLRREVASSADLLALESVVVTGLDADDRRIIAGRTFGLRDGVWTQAGTSEELRVVRIKLYSDAYFALLREAPELRPVVAELEPVLVRGGRVALLFGDEGEDRLAPGRITGLLADFRAPGSH